MRLLAATVRLYAMDATALLPAVADLRPLPGESPIIALEGQSDAVTVRR